MGSCLRAPVLGGCQNCGPFLGPWYNTTLGDPKGDHSFDNHPCESGGVSSTCPNAGGMSTHAAFRAHIVDLGTILQMRQGQQEMLDSAASSGWGAAEASPGHSFEVWATNPGPCSVCFFLV